MKKLLLFITLVLFILTSINVNAEKGKKRPYKYQFKSPKIKRFKKKIEPAKVRFRMPLLPVKKGVDIKTGTLTKNVVLGLKNPSEYCLDDGNLYKGADYRINDINIVFSNDVNTKKIAGKPVVLYGKLKKDMTKIIKKVGECPEDYGREQSMMQLRSDWMAPETGFSVGKSTFEILRNTYYFEVSKLYLYNGIKSYKDKSGNMNVTFTNLFEDQLEDVKITAHYETTFGKPAPIYEDKSYKALAPRKSVQAVFKNDGKVETTYRDRRKSEKRLESIIITAKVKSQDIRFEIYPK